MKKQKRQKQPKPRDPNVPAMVLRGGKGVHRNKKVKEICPECGRVLIKGVCDCDQKK